jgi:hypothetical protein
MSRDAVAEVRLTALRQACGRSTEKQSRLLAAGVPKKHPRQLLCIRSKDEVRTAILSYIEVFHDPRRRHKGPGRKSPAPMRIGA